MAVAGAGNWLLGADRIGPLVLERGAARWGGAVELIDIGSTALALLDRLHGQELLIVVDACLGGGPPGEVRVVEPDLAGLEGPSTSVHQIGPLESLAVARELWPERMPRRTVLVTVETEGLDDVLEEGAVQRVLRLLDREIAAVGSVGGRTTRRTTEGGWE